MGFFLKTKLQNFINSTAFHVVFGFFILCVAFILPHFLCPIVWQTNDDVGMSMTAAGYGLAAAASNSLLYSNVVFGSLVQMTPEFLGVPGYTWISYAFALGFAGSILYVASFRISKNSVTSGLATLAILLPATSFPQFTMTAGICTISGLLGIYVSLVPHRIGVLVSGIFLVLLGYSMRSGEAELILLVTSIFFLERRLLKNSIPVAMVIGGGALLLWWIDWHHYQALEWASFNEFETIRFYFTDFRYDQILSAHPDLLRQNGFTNEDIALIRNWFAADPSLISPKRLTSLLDSIPFSEWFRSGLGVDSLLSLSSIKFSPFVAVAALLTYLNRPFFRMFISLILTFAMVFVMGAAGRPGIFRATFPLILCVVAFGFAELRGSYAKTCGIILSFLLLIFSINQFNSKEVLQEKIRSTQQDIESLSPDRLYVVWGDQFPYEFAYLPFEVSDHARRLKFFGLDASSLTPDSQLRLKGEGNGSLIEWLSSGKSVPLIANSFGLDLMKTYCSQRMSTHLQILRQQNLKNFSIYEITCSH